MPSRDRNIWVGRGADTIPPRSGDLSKQAESFSWSPGDPAHRKGIRNSSIACGQQGACAYIQPNLREGMGRYSLRLREQHYRLSHLQPAGKAVPGSSQCSLYHPIRPGSRILFWSTSRKIRVSSLILSGCCSFSNFSDWKILRYPNNERIINIQYK